MTELDTFESALLRELRREVSEHPAPAPAPARRPRTRLRLAAIAATGVAASVAAVVGLGGSGGSPAYAVEKDSHGDVIVTVHRLDGAAGLEKALRAQGLDVDVSYDGHGTEVPESAPATAAPTAGPSAATGGLPPGVDDACSQGKDPATLTQHGGDWVLRIPADSPLQDRHVVIRTVADGTLAVNYVGNLPGSLCGIIQMP